MSVQSYEGGSQSFVDDTLQSEMTVTTSSIPPTPVAAASG
jgi:hypothetical protein